MSRDKLAEALWEDDPPVSWESALRVLVSKLRRLLADHADLTATAGGYRLELPTGAWVDVVAAEEAAGDAEQALGASDLETAIQAATIAESLLREPFLLGDEGSWARAERRQLENVRTRALDALAEASLHSGQAEAAVRWAGQAVEAEPFREAGHRRLMKAHAAAGNRAEALRVYDRCRRLLADELGAYPSPETEAMYRELLEEPSPPPAARPGGITAASRPSGRLVALGAAGLLVAGAVAAAYALANRGGSSPVVLPSSVVRIDPKTLKLTELASVGDAPDLIVASGGYLWVTNHILRERGSGEPRNAGDHTLTRIDPSTGKKVVVGGGLAPCGITGDPSGDVWVANCYPPIGGLHDDVVRVGAGTLAFKKTWPVPGGDGFYRGLSYGGGFLWLSQIVGGDRTNANTVTQIDPQTGAARTVRLARAASGLAWSGGYGELWINNFDDGSLTRLQPETGATHAVAGVASAPAFPVVDGNAVWVGDWSAPQVVRVNATGIPRIRRISLPSADGGVWAVAVGADAVWAATHDDRAVWRVDPKTGRATRIPLPYSPAGVSAGVTDVWVTLRR